MDKINKVLITGGAGFIGSNLVNKLSKKYPKLKIYILDNYFSGNASNHIQTSPNLFYQRGNTWDVEEIYKDMSFDIVFHFGEYSRIVQSFRDVNYVMKSNLHGTTKILEMCRKWNAKLIYSASSSKFGNEGKDENLSPYSWVKSKMVELIKNYNEWYNLQYEICYFFNVYGPNQITEGDYATVIGIFEKQYKNNKPLTVVTPGTQSRDFTHIFDVVEGVIKTTYMNMNREWMLRAGINYKIIDVANMFTNNIKIIPERRGERFTSKEFEDDTEKVLNWKPKYNLEKYIKNLKYG